MASYNGESDCRSDEDKDDGRSPVYATCSSAHGVPRSWFGKQASAHQARVIHSLAQAHAAHAACYLSMGNKPIQVAPLLSEKFTEPGDYKMCCKAPDYS